MIKKFYQFYILDIDSFIIKLFQKEFYWDPSNDSQVKIQWRTKIVRRYNDFISGFKKKGKWSKYIPEETWESLMSILEKY